MNISNTISNLADDLDHAVLVVGYGTIAGQVGASFCPSRQCTWKFFCEDPDPANKYILFSFSNHIQIMDRDPD